MGAVEATEAVEADAVGATEAGTGIVGIGLGKGGGNIATEATEEGVEATEAGPDKQGIEIDTGFTMFTLFNKQRPNAFKARSMSTYALLVRKDSSTESTYSFKYPATSCNKVFVRWSIFLQKTTCVVCFTKHFQKHKALFYWALFSCIKCTVVERQ